MMVGDYGNLGDWVPFLPFVAPAAGTYVLQFGSANTGATDPSNIDDPNVSSAAFMDGVSITVAPIPEPASWAMMVGGFLGLGVAMRAGGRRRLAVATA
jgi:hypothetical protein